MKLTIKINLDNAAFEDGDGVEIARILGDLAERLPFPTRKTNGALQIHDSNGNHCGTAEITE